MPEQKADFDSVEQLRTLITRYPADPVDIHGVILDYIGQSGESLFDVLELNHSIYKSIFVDNVDRDGVQLLKCVVGSKDEADSLSATCRDHYPKVSDLIEEVREVSSDDAIDLHDLLVDPSRALDRSVEVVVWQLSDLHFGKYNKLEKDPRELAYQIASVAAKSRKLTPDVVLVSGDVSSIAAKKEFDDFCLFCEHIGKALWGIHHPERILVVPGNHDISWRSNGRADQMRLFQNHVSTKGVCITPFGPDAETLGGGSALVSRVSSDPKAVPPLALVRYPEHNIEFLLLVSGYFSGMIPDEIRKLLRSTGATPETLQSLLRVDEGAVNQEYLFNMSALSTTDGHLRMALTHHNPIQYGTETCANRLAPKLLETLRDVGVPVLLHGHVHLTEEPDSHREVLQHQAYPLPCTTLCSDCVAGGKGLSVHLVSRKASTMIHSLVWPVASTSGFKAGSISVRYRLEIDESGTLISRT